MHSLGILYDFSRENLEALLVLIQMLICALCFLFLLPALSADEASFDSQRAHAAAVEVAHAVRARAVQGVAG